MWVGILLGPSPQWYMCQHTGTLPHVWRGGKATGPQSFTY